MLDLIPPSDWLEAHEWAEIGVVSSDAVYRLHIAGVRKEIEAQLLASDGIVEELEAAYGVAFETDGLGNFRRSP